MSSSSAGDPGRTSNGPVRISGEVLEAIQRRETAHPPREVCGLLLGDAREIVKQVPIRNIAAEPTRFEMDPLAIARAERRARAAGLALIGYYHSHPSGRLEPSRRDRSGRIWPDLGPSFHLIVSPKGRWRLYNMRAARWTAARTIVVGS